MDVMLGKKVSSFQLLRSFSHSVGFVPPGHPLHRETADCFLRQRFAYELPSMLLTKMLTGEWPPSLVTLRGSRESEECAWAGRQKLCVCSDPVQAAKLFHSATCIIQGFSDSPC